jgi:threonine efflux protein
MRAALGIVAGLCVHAALMAVLVAALTEVGDSPLLKALQLAGAAYLAWLGCGLLRAKSVEHRETADETDPLMPTATPFFVQGFLTNLTNPKVLVFFASIVSPFLATDDLHRAVVVILGILVAVPVWYGALSVFSGRLLHGRTARKGRLIDVIAGSVFVAVALYGAAMCCIA